MSINSIILPCLSLASLHVNGPGFMAAIIRAAWLGYNYHLNRSPLITTAVASTFTAGIADIIAQVCVAQSLLIETLHTRARFWHTTSRQSVSTALLTIEPMIAYNSLKLCLISHTQNIISSKFRIRTRTFAIACYGLCWGGPSAHFWHKLMESWFSGESGIKASLAKVRSGIPHLTDWQDG